MARSWAVGARRAPAQATAAVCYCRVDILWWALVYAAFSLYCWVSVCLECGTSREIPMFKQRGGALHENLMAARDTNRQGLYSSLEKHCINPFNILRFQKSHAGWAFWLYFMIHSSFALCQIKLHHTQLHTDSAFSPMKNTAAAVLPKNRHPGSWGCIQSILLNLLNTSPCKNRNNCLLTEELAVSSS